MHDGCAREKHANLAKRLYKMLSVFVQPQLTRLRLEEHTRKIKGKKDQRKQRSKKAIQERSNEE